MKKSKLLLTSLGILGIASTFAIPMVSCGDPQKYFVVVNSRFGAIIDNNVATENQEFNANIKLDPALIPEGRDYSIYDITINVGDKTLTQDVDFYFDYYSGDLTINNNIIDDNVSIFIDPGRIVVADEYCTQAQYPDMPDDGLSSEPFKYPMEHPNVDDKFIFVASLSEWGGDVNQVPNNYLFHSVQSQSAPIAEWCEVYVYQHEALSHFVEGTDYEVVKEIGWIDSVHFLSSSAKVQELDNSGYVILAVDETKSLITIENDYHFIAWYTND